MGIYDLSALKQKLSSGSSQEKMEALEKLAWDLYGDSKQEVMQIMAIGLYDPDNFVAVRAARFLMTEAGPDGKHIRTARTLSGRPSGTIIFTP